MTKFKFLRDVAILSMMIATQAQAHGIKGREIAAPSWSAPCLTDRGISGDHMSIYGRHGGQAGKRNAVSPEVDLPPWIGD